MRADALADLVVLDLAQDVAGPYCAKLFADFGASVIKLEPANNSPTTTRRRNPSPRQGPSREHLGRRR